MIAPIDFVCACPEGYEPNADLVAKVKAVLLTRVVHFVTVVGAAMCVGGCR